jgi:hypothetical protein
VSRVAVAKGLTRHRATTHEHTTATTDRWEGKEGRAQGFKVLATARAASGPINSQRLAAVLGRAARFRYLLWGAGAHMRARHAHIPRGVRRSTRRRPLAASSPPSSSASLQSE